MWLSLKRVFPDAVREENICTLTAAKAHLPGFITPWLFTELFLINHKNFKECNKAYYKHINYFCHSN